MPPPRPHPLARAPLVDRLDRMLNAGWDKGWITPIPLDAESLIERASKGYVAGDDHGGRTAGDVEDFYTRLEHICAAIAEEAQLNAVGQSCAYGLLTRAIQQRLALGKLWRERPELIEAEIAPPIIVVGQMRSGTTRIHRLLAADPAHSATRFCDSWHPVPERPDLRPLKGGFKLFMARRIDPWIDALHPFGAKRPDEELGWLASALDHSAYEAQWRIPSYVAFSEACDPAPIYREFARLLRTDAVQHGTAQKPRILKVPQFTEDLPALLAQFPDAKLVVSRRCDAETLRSSTSLVANQMCIQSDNVDLEWIEQEWRRKLAFRSSRMDAALADFTGTVAEIHFDELGADWESEMARLYAELDLEFSETVRAAMRREMQSSEASPHHAHSDDLKRFQNAANTPDD